MLLCYCLSIRTEKDEEQYICLFNYYPLNQNALIQSAFPQVKLSQLSIVPVNEGTSSNNETEEIVNVPL